MRWLFGVLFVLAALAAGAFAAGFYLLSPVSEVTRSIEIARPASVIYPLLTNLKTFNDYSPWFDRDPKADYEYDGPAEGTGQIARWDSSVADLGQGSITIVKTIENREVDAQIVFGGSPIPFAPPARPLSKFMLTPTARGVMVAWTLSSKCNPDIIGVPCRLVNFVSQWGVSQQFDIALTKLKFMGEQLPALDITDMKPERGSIAAMDFAYVEGAPPQGMDQFRAALRQAFSTVDGFMKQFSLAPAAPPMAVTVRGADGRDVLRAGRPFEGALPVVPFGVNVKIGKSPGGPVLRVVYTGPYDGMQPTYAKLDAYVRSHRLTAMGNPWEVYIDDPDKTSPAQLRTEIYFPIQ